MKLRNIVLSLLILISSAPQANARREKQALEAFELSSLQLDAVYSKGLCQPYASIRDPGGYLHRIFMGDYIGKKFGRVIEFTERGVKLRELIETRIGEWQEIETWLTVPTSQP